MPLIISLAFVGFLIWEAWQQDYGPKPLPPVTTAPVEQAGTVPAPAAPTSDIPAAPAAQPPAVDAVPAVADTTKAAPAAPTQQRIHVRTDLLDVEIDTSGGDLRRIDLLTYPVSLEEPGHPFRLFSDAGEHIFFAQTGLLGDKNAPNHHALYSAPKTEYLLAPGQERLEVPLTWVGENGVSITKTFLFRRDSYEVELLYSVNNMGGKPWKGRLYGQLQRAMPGRSGSSNFIYTYTGAILHTEHDPYDKHDFDRIRETPASVSTTGGWAAMIQHYFSAALIPGASFANHYYTKALNNGRFAVGVINPDLTVAAGQAGQTGLKFFIGPKEQERLTQAAPGLELLVDYGVLSLIAQPIYWLLEYIHQLVGNWGWAIILLTILIKLVFYKLSEASYTSMANMRRVQPRLMQLKERYGDDKARMNQAMMEMYKKEKINPLGGCLPILVQIPVFISLYWVLLESVELRQSPFIFWIKDLAVHDPYFVLPLLMGASMLVQQKLNPAPMDPMQAKVMMALPFIFTFLFLWFPSGLVLYWFVNNTLSIAQQWVITRRIEAKGGK